MISDEGSAIHMQDTNWVTLLATSDRRGGATAPARKPPTELIWKAALPDAVALESGAP